MKSSGIAHPLIYSSFRRTASPWAAWTERILDPGSEIVIKWNRIFLVTCLVALFLDPLYFYIQSIGGSACFRVDLNLGIAVTFFRSVTDLFYLAHMLLKFRTAFVAPSSRVFGRGELVMDPKQIAMRYLKSHFVIDLAATLPLPQVVIWCIIPAMRSLATNRTHNTLALIVLIQYVPRLFLIYPLNARLVKTTGVVAKTAWVGAAYNILLFMLASHVLGACWYLLSIERLRTCWIAECVKEDAASMMTQACTMFLDCGSMENPERKAWMNHTKVHEYCDPTSDNLKFKYGLFEDALTHNVVRAKFREKYLYCLWWGLRNLSSYGQNLATTTYVGETLFCILICIVGLVLFSHLIGNMQTYISSITLRIEEWRVKKRDTEEWMRHRQLPEELQERVRKYDQYKWLATRGVDEESILQSLPLDLRRDIQRHLCLGLVRRVPFFSRMDDQLLDAICERLFSSLSTQDTYIVREGDLVNEMFFIIRGQLESSTTGGGRSGFYNSITLGPGDFCGEELLTWALMPNSSNLPSSTRTVRALVEVEAFVLQAEDLKFVATQFKRLQSKKLQHAFRYYSHQWRTWGACFIQAAWRRHKKRKLAKELESGLLPPSPGTGEASDYGEMPSEDEHEDDFEDAYMENMSHQHLGASILASKFAKNTRRASHRVKRSIKEASGLKMPKLMKPVDPDFSVDENG